MTRPPTSKHLGLPFLFSDFLNFRCFLIIRKAALVADKVIKYAKGLKLENISVKFPSDFSLGKFNNLHHR